MKKTIHTIISSAIALVLFLNAGVIYAATFTFDPTSTSVRPDNTFEVDINVDASVDQIAGTDIYLSYDATMLEVQSITDGSYFPQVEDVPATGRVYISGFVNTQGDYKTGTGTVATVKFKALTEGSTSLTIDCDPSITDTSKIVRNDTAVTNVLECSSLSSHPVTISASAPDNGTSTTTTNSVTELPQSGVVEDMITFAVWGGILLGIGALLRIILRIV